MFHNMIEKFAQKQELFALQAKDLFMHKTLDKCIEAAESYLKENATALMDCYLQEEKVPSAHTLLMNTLDMASPQCFPYIYDDEIEPTIELLAQLKNRDFLPELCKKLIETTSLKELIKVVK